MGKSIRNLFLEIGNWMLRKVSLLSMFMSHAL